MGLLLQGGSANIADIQFEGGSGNKTITIPKEGGKLAVGPMLSGATPYHFLQGDLSVSNEVITNGFSTTLYTGNGGTQAVATVVDMATQHGNDVSETYGGLVWLKNRDTAAYNNFLFDSVRGVPNYIVTNSTAAQAVGATILTTFNNNGFSLGNYIEVNGSTKLNASWSFQTTHRRTGTTNHGKAFTEHYNPFTGFTIIKYEGSGLAGHEIPHSLGRKLGFRAVKNLSIIIDWVTEYDDNGYLNLNTTNAFVNVYKNSSDDKAYIINGGGTIANWNASANQYILYGWANSYFDESNKLIGNYKIGTYQGTGLAGNKVTTKGKPAWIMIKRLDSTGDWAIKDNLRGSTKLLYANASVAEETDQNVNFSVDGFIIQNTNTDMNASGGQYLYMVVYDNDSGSGKSKYPKATDSSQLSINNAIIPFAQGIDSNGTKVSTISKNETIAGLTYTAGKNYVYSKLDGTYGVTKYIPRYLESDLIAKKAGDNPDYFDVLKNKWFSTNVATNIGDTITINAEITTGRNYLNHIVYADNDGVVLYVEELPKIEYKDIVKANEFRGKNSCTVLISFDGTTTPITIRDNYNVSAIIRVATGVFDIYFKEQMDNTGYSIAGTGQSYDVESLPLNRYLNKVQITTGVPASTRYNDAGTTVIIMGGKN